MKTRLLDGVQTRTSKISWRKSILFKENFLILKSKYMLLTTVVKDVWFLTSRSSGMKKGFILFWRVLTYLKAPMSLRSLNARLNVAKYWNSSKTLRNSVITINLLIHEKSAVMKINSMRKKEKHIKNKVIIVRVSFWKWKEELTVGN